MSTKTHTHLLTILIFFALIGCMKPRDNNLVWTAINVNSTGKQGDAHLISKHNIHFLIDTGQVYYVQKVLIPFLRKNNIKEIKGIMITHPHFDHYGGLATLMQSNIKIRNIYMNMPTKAQMDYEYWGGHYSDLLKIQEIAKRKKISLHTIKRGDKYSFDRVSYFKVLYAYDGIHTPVGKTDINDMSIITMLNDGDNKFLFTGDLNKKLGGYLAKHAKDIKADILKFPHHGTEGFAPNDFFEAVAPETIIVPGPSNIWCSDKSKRARLLASENHYHTYINGFHGHITVISNQKSYTIFTENNPLSICEN